MLLKDREQFRKVIVYHLQSRGEVWAFHPKYANILVSTLGKVKNFITGTEFAIRKTRQGYRECCLPMFQTLGYKKTISKLVHRLVAETFFDYLPYENYEVNHMNGDKSDNSIYNINWLTRQENLQHSRDNKLYKPRYGSDNGMFKYTNEDIKVLDNLRKEGYTLKELGYLMDMKEGSMFNLLKRRRCE